MDRVDVQGPSISRKESASDMTDGSYPIPNSSQFVLPMMLAPEFLIASTTVASKGDEKSCKVGVRTGDEIGILGAQTQ